MLTIATGNSQNPSSGYPTETICVICSENSSNCIVCASKHATCNVCFSRYVKITWLCKNFPLGEIPQVRCACVGCSAPPFSSQEIAKHGDPEAWTVYEDQVGKAKLAGAIGRIQEEAEQQLVRQRNATVTTTTSTITSQSTTATASHPTATSTVDQVQPTTTSGSATQTQPENELAPMSDADVQSKFLLAKQLGLQLKDPKMCPRCQLGPVEIIGCPDLAAHHGNRRSHGLTTDNSCQCCGFFSVNAADWPAWDGVVRDATTSTWTGMTKKRKIELISQAFECDEERAKDVLAVGQVEIAKATKRARLSEMRERTRDRLPVPPALEGINFQRRPFALRALGAQSVVPLSVPVLPFQRANYHAQSAHARQSERPTCQCTYCRTNGAEINPVNLLSSAHRDPSPNTSDYNHDFVNDLMLGPILENDLRFLSEVRMDEAATAARGATTTTTATRTTTFPSGPSPWSPLRSRSVMIPSSNQTQPNLNPQVQVVEEMIDAGNTSWRFHVGQETLECSRRGLTITLFRRNTVFEVTDDSETRRHYFLSTRRMRIEIPLERRLSVREEGWGTSIPIRFGDWNVAIGADDIILFNSRHEYVIDLMETLFSTDSFAG